MNVCTHMLFFAGLGIVSADVSAIPASVVADEAAVALENDGVATGMLLVQHH